MKKIIILSLMIFVICILSSCDSFKHEHILDEQWSYDEEFHWKSITCTQNRCMIEYVTYKHEDLNDDNICDVCGYTNNNVHNHTWTYHVEDEVGHFKTFTCGCPSEEGTTPHADFNKDGLCDECHYNMGNSHPKRWSITDDGHTEMALCGCCEYQAIEYPHEDSDNNNICDVCDYLILKQENDVPTTSWVNDVGTVLFSYNFSVGDTFRFSEGNIYVNETIVFTFADTCKHHSYEYYIDSIKVVEGIYTDYIEKVTVKRVPIDYYIEVYNYNPYNRFPVSLPFNCEYATLGMDIITPGNYSEYKCAGVYFDEDFKNEVTNPFDVLELENKVLYVKWEVVIRTVTFIYGDDNSYVEVIEVPANDNIIRMPIPDKSIIKQNYRYVYWILNTGDEYYFDEQYLVASDDIVFYLVWVND